MNDTGRPMATDATGKPNPNEPAPVSPPPPAAKGCGVGALKGLIIAGVLLVGAFVVLDIPCLLDSIARSRQKRATQEIKAMAAALQKFHETYGGYPPSRLSGNPHETLAGLMETMDRGQGKSPLPPFSKGGEKENDGKSPLLPLDKGGKENGSTIFPDKDPWGHPYIFRSGPDGGAANPMPGSVTSEHFVLGSLGSDGKEGGGDRSEGALSAIAAAWCSSQPRAAGTAETHCYEADIVWADGSFLQAPEGKQKKCG